MVRQGGETEGFVNRWFPLAVRGSSQIAALSCLLALAPPAAAIASPTGPATQAATAHRWIFHADVDGDGHADRILIKAGKDLKRHVAGWTGHYTVHVRLSSRHRTATKRLKMAFDDSERKPFTPYVGAANVDGRAGREVLTGATTYAHTQVFHVLVARGSHLHVLVAPGHNSWDVNASFGTGDQGWRCVPSGVERRSAVPSRHGRWYHVVRDTYERRSGSWRRVHHVSRHIKARKPFVPPAFLVGYDTFDCHGLPRAVRGPG
jgi:hypothetical protein